MDAAYAKDRLNNTSPRHFEIMALNSTANFKSKVPKIGYMMGEEKRIRGLHGPKKDLKYQIKLNDVVLDSADQRSRSTEPEGHNTSTIGGRLILGTNFND